MSKTLAELRKHLARTRAPLGNGQLAESIRFLCERVDGLEVSLEKLIKMLHDEAPLIQTVLDTQGKEAEMLRDLLDSHKRMAQALKTVGESNSDAHRRLDVWEKLGLRKPKPGEIE